MNRTPNLRRSLGVRLWTTGGAIRIKGGQIAAVDADVLVEGHDEWLGGTWSLNAIMPQHVREQYAEVKQPWPELNR